METQHPRRGFSVVINRRDLYMYIFKEEHIKREDNLHFVFLVLRGYFN